MSGQSATFNKMIGTRLAHYDVTGHLGTGGMGEVYQAMDSKLGRSVAIKLLPEAFARDAERIARFEREARVLASLNHPHIAAIHGLEESAGRNFLVMELVAGTTLADRIAQGAIPVKAALPIAKQIAEALDAAHEKGIVHRDLKPANIKVTPEGQVKVLDFGLAKAFSDEATQLNLSNSPTLSRAATNAGVILGTAAYMSPEQAKGLNVDRRADIFAFGSVLYEMLTGRGLFPGETVTEILARVIEREPDWTKLPADLPPRIVELLRRCLEKDPRRRRRDMGDVRFEIEQAITDPIRNVGQEAPATARGSRLSWVFASVMAIALAAVITRIYFRPVVESHEMRVDIVTPSSPDNLSFAISPDAKHLVFVAVGTSEDRTPRLWLRSLENTMAQPLAGTEGASFPFWSPDSHSVVFFAASKLKRLDIGGGLPQTLADAPLGRGGSWNSDGVILFTPSSTLPLMRIPAAGGTPVAVTKLNAPHQYSHRFPQFLPDGKKFLFYVQGTEDVAGTYLGSLDNSETKRLMATDTAAFFAAPDWIFFLRQGTLMARHFDLSSGEVTGDPITVADPVAFDSNVNFPGFSISASGPVVYRSGGASRHQLTWFDRSGKRLGTLGASDETTLMDPELSPDGRRVAVDRTVQGNTDVWIIDGTRTTRATFDNATDHWPIWSADGSKILFDSSRKLGNHDLYWKSAGGEGNEEVLFESMQSKGAMDASPDGRFLMYSNDDPKTGRDMWILPLTGDRTPRPFLNSPFLDAGAQFSPDGHWVAYQSNESGRFEVYIRPFPGPGGQWQVSSAGGASPRWRADGKELYFLGLDSRMMAASITIRGATVEPGTPVALFRTDIVGAGAAAGAAAARPQYDVSSDGRFLVNETVEDVAVTPITLLLNWKPSKK